MATKRKEKLIKPEDAEALAEALKKLQRELEEQGYEIEFEVLYDN